MSDEQNTTPVEETSATSSPAPAVVAESAPVSATEAAPSAAAESAAAPTAEPAPAVAAAEPAPAPVAEPAPAATEAAPTPVVTAAEPTPTPVAEPVPAEQPTTSVQAAAVNTTTTTAPVIPKVPSPQEDFSGYVDWVKSYGNSVQKEIVRVMENYYAVMQPGRLVKDEEGAKMQYALFTLINGVLNTPRPEDFVSSWNTILAYYAQYNNSIFGIRMVNRFLHMWPGSQTAYNMLLAANNLIMLTANPKTRSNSLKQVNLDKTMRQGFTDLARQRVMEFYA